jgi:exonuclease SbcC
MLLAQGGFAAFLNAEAGKRAELLEQITGTEIYGKISKEVFNRFRDEEVTLTRLRDHSQSVDVLTAEAIDEQQDKKAQLDSNIKQAQQDLAEHQQAITNLNNHQSAQQQLALTQKNTQQAEQALKDNAPALLQLANSEPANKLRPLFNNAKQEAQGLSGLITTAEALTASQQLNAEQITQFTPKKIAEQAAFDALKKESKTVNSLITEQIIPLDEKIKGLTTQLSQCRTEDAQIKQQLSVLQNDSQQLNNSVQQGISEKATLDRYLSDNAHHANLQSALPLWQSKFEDRAHKKQQLTQLEKALLSTQADIKTLHATQAQQQQQTVTEDAKLLECQAAQTHKQNTLNALLNGESIDAVQATFYQQSNLQSALTDCTHLYESYVNNANNLTLQQQQLQQLVTDQTAANSVVEQLRASYSQQKKLIEQIEKSVKLEQQIVSLKSHRDNLQPQQACPLCGATEHPAITSYQATNSTNSEQQLDTEKQALTALQEQGAKAKTTLDQLSIQCSAIAASNTALTHTLQQQVAGWGTTSQPFNWNVAIEHNTSAIPALLQQALTQRQTAQQRYQAVEQADKALKATSELTLKQAQNLQDLRHNQNIHAEKTAQCLKQETHALQQLQTTQQDLKDTEAQLANQLQQQELQLPSLQDQTQWLQARANESHHYQEKTAEQSQLAKAIQQHTSQHENALQQLADKTLQAGKLSTQLNQLQSNIKQHSDTRISLFENKDCLAERNRLAERVARVEQTLKILEQTAQTLNTAAHTLQAQLTDNTAAQTAQRIKQGEAQSQWHNALLDSPFDTEQSFNNALLDNAQQQQLTELKQTLDAQRVTCQALQQQANDAVTAANKITLSDKSTDQLLQLIEAANNDTSTANKQLGEIEQRLKADTLKRDQQKSLLLEVEAQQQTYDDWNYLKSLIGSSDGKKFRVFAQGLTLDHLIYLANMQLIHLHSRYQLDRKKGEALELEVIDTWQGDAVRDTKTLSGGESFLVSLALALALSDLVSHKTKIDSLFLDEGFGTLDRETLDIALDALDNLNASGKMIGVISHVEALKERIPVQIEIKKMSGLGVSRLDRRFGVSK